ncbi:MAG: hypothetical protein LBJ62_09715 [Bifidobacteriaceae bacterium]|jgi:glutamate synthase domain-containing protein 3|nr:hypothetical protein [Bifidobacteriaceae bacterium]
MGTSIITSPISYDLATGSVTELNQALHQAAEGSTWQITNPGGAHAIAAGLDRPMTVRIDGPVGYYAAGMNQAAVVEITGHAGVGLAENMMSGLVHVTGSASQSAGATAHGGLLVIDGDAAARCGISMKGVSIVVGGNVGHMSAFMAQAGCLVICGDAGDGLGDSIYEAHIYVKGRTGQLGADCVEKPLRPEHISQLTELLTAAGRPEHPEEFRRYGSARQLYNFHVDHAFSY